MSLVQKIRDLGNQGEHPKKIAKKLHCSRTYVYKVFNLWDIDYKKHKEVREPSEEGLPVKCKNKNLNYRDRQYPFN